MLENTDSENRKVNTDEEILDLTRELCARICLSGTYRSYYRCSRLLDQHEALAARVNEFRARNLACNLEEQDEEKSEKTRELYLEYQDVLSEPVVMDFLAAEQEICRLLRRVHNTMAMNIPLNLSHMKEREEL